MRPHPTQRILRTLLLVLLAPAAGCRDAARPANRTAEAEPGIETVSLLGQPLRPPVLDEPTRLDRERALGEARAAYEGSPDDPAALIWLGRRTAYLGRYREAVEIFTRGIERHPEDPRMYRHRGHRYVTLRSFDLAARDLERGCRLVEGKPDEVEPDGLPNARNIPTSTLQTNLWYHLGLARYLMGDFEAAESAYRRCLALSANPDMRVATSHWLYMTLRRLERPAEAAALLGPIEAGMEIIENRSYHRLLLLYKAELPLEELLPESAGGDPIDLATIGYGVGNWHLYNGRATAADALFRRVVAGEQWAAFGHIAAEADLARAEPGPAPDAG